MEHRGRSYTHCLWGHVKGADGDLGFEGSIGVYQEEKEMKVMAKVQKRQVPGRRMLFTPLRVQRGPRGLPSRSREASGSAPRGLCASLGWDPEQGCSPPSPLRLQPNQAAAWGLPAV